MPDVRNQPDAPPAPAPESHEWVTLNRAVDETGITRYRLMKAALRNAITVEERGGITFVTRASLERFVAEQGAAAPAPA
jgi:hypothetical protein